MKVKAENGKRNKKQPVDKMAKGQNFNIGDFQKEFKDEKGEAIRLLKKFRADKILQGIWGMRRW